MREKAKGGSCKCCGSRPAYNIRRHSLRIECASFRANLLKNLMGRSIDSFGFARQIKRDGSEDRLWRRWPVPEAELTGTERSPADPTSPLTTLSRQASRAACCALKSPYVRNIPVDVDGGRSSRRVWCSSRGS